MEKILEIGLDSGVKHTCYVVFNNDVGVGCNSLFFEGIKTEDSYIKPLKEAKMWAKNHGYTHLKVISMSLKKSDKIYTL